MTKSTQNSQYARSLIEASLDPLVTISTEGKIMDMNQATLTITDLTYENMLGTDFSEYFTEPQKAKQVYMEVFEKGFVVDYPLTIRDHKLRDVLFNGSVFKDEEGNVLGAVVVARDITEKKLIETAFYEAKVAAEHAMGIAEVAKSNAESATKVAEEATQVAEGALKSKQQFLSNMSHEIRTPMNAIIGFTKVMLRTELSAKQREYLTAIKVSGDSMIVLINDILDLAKVDSGKMTFEQIPFKLAVSIAAILHLFEPKIQEKNLILFKEYDPVIPEVLIGDPVRLHQIILNLLSNAVKFTAKGKITVSVILISEDDTGAVIEFAVTDTGIGISAIKIETIFENFQQATSSTSRLFGGTGLGLAIVKQLVESQGGTTMVSSEITEGSRFSFRLLFKKTTAKIEADLANMEPETDLKNVKILVVEDIPLNQLLMKTLLDDFGFERDIAANGKIAIEKLRNNTYDIILMDLQMPEMNGFEATEYIRNTMHLKIPIIALTADVTTVDLEKCRAVGMNDYLAKPVDDRALFSKIMGLVKKSNGEVMEIPEKITQTSPVRYVDLRYLTRRTHADPTLMIEMISLYLEQTPPLILAMRQSLIDGDWSSLHAAVHKMIPSFSIMGIHADFEDKARRVQQFANAQEQSGNIHDLVTELENVCTQACKELKEELNRIKKELK